MNLPYVHKGAVGKPRVTDSPGQDLESLQIPTIFTMNYRHPPKDRRNGVKLQVRFVLIEFVLVPEELHLRCLCTVLPLQARSARQVIGEGKGLSLQHKITG